MWFSAKVPSTVCQDLQSTKISPFPTLLHWYFAAVCMHRHLSSISTNSPRPCHQHQHELASASQLENCTNITGSGNREVLVAIEAEGRSHLCTRFRGLHTKPSSRPSRAQSLRSQTMPSSNVSRRREDRAGQLLLNSSEAKPRQHHSQLESKGSSSHPSKQPLKQASREADFQQRTEGNECFG